MRLCILLKYSANAVGVALLLCGLLYDAVTSGLSPPIWILNGFVWLLSGGKCQCRVACEKMRRMKDVDTRKRVKQLHEHVFLVK